eukprot:CAMPEP_0197408872 /NCGR_PEP_ID=MMETSP1165-20131217/29073_1 /TAXON_ID=284809 /ORGANISM="Chrysocystis fragilis, Strain CCMP3189" /LENGTH=69 /DNA_ID=CAMNT_0042935309 /DNA_START=125 /DNA_END=330 /DNA_ORIENTATION=+
MHRGAGGGRKIETKGEARGCRRSVSQPESAQVGSLADPGYAGHGRMCARSAEQTGALRLAAVFIDVGGG